MNTPHPGPSALFLDPRRAAAASLGAWLAAFGATSASAQSLAVTLTDAAAAVPGALVVTPSTWTPPNGTDAPGPSQLPGWPQVVPGNGTFAPVRGLVFADLDGDGQKDVIMSSTDNRVYAWDPSGAPLPGFPRLLSTTVNRFAQSAPAVGDLDGDGNLEIVQDNRGVTSGGMLYVLDAAGNDVAPFPISVNAHNFAGSPTLYDLDDDGELEIIIADRDYPIGWLRVIERDGTEWTNGGWPLQLDHVPTCTAGIADLDGDGSPELVYMSYNSIYVVGVTGVPLAGWPQSIPNANFSYQSPALADLDSDGDLEVIVGAHQTAAGIYAFHHTGVLVPGWPKLVGTWTYCAPTVADIDGDGAPDVLSGREGTGPGVPGACFWAWSATGAVLPGFPYTANGGGSAGPITVTDLDGDGSMEIFADHNVLNGTQGYLFGVDANGNDLPGFPLRPNGFTYQNGAVIDDIDGDGDVELGVVSYDPSTISTNVYVNVYDLDESYSFGKTVWGTYHRHARRGGGERPRIDVVGDASLGGNVTLRVAGEIGDRAWLWLGTSITHTNTPFGWVHLTFPYRRAYANGIALGASGQLVSGQPIPAVPNLVGLDLYFQAQVRWTGGGVTSDLARVTIQ